VIAGVRRRIIAFLVLSAVGIVYVAATYLGIVDAVLGRGFTVQAQLPSSGGLYVGSAVNYRGVQVGRVTDMTVTREGVTLELSLEEGTELPLASPMFVHNLSAVGEQYLDFEPREDSGVYAEEGDVFVNGPSALPVDEADLLVELDQFVDSVDSASLQVLIRELGDMFEDTGRPLQQLLDDGGAFIDRASAGSADTLRLLDTARTVLETQREQGENIRSFSRDLADLTTALRASDRDLRTVLDDTPGTAREVTALMEDLEPTLPVLLNDLITVNQVVVSHLPGVEQLLVTFPRVIAGGFTGSPPDGFGRVNLQLDYSVPPCTDGYKPREEWRRGDELSDAPIFPAECRSGAPFVQRGTPNVPGSPSNPGARGGGTPSPARSYSASYDPDTGMADGVLGAGGRPVRLVPPEDLALLGDDSWKWLLLGPVTS
jgi:phospholipid/cholesterol/gamma-HCH transport system substrate-binding protein